MEPVSLPSTQAEALAVIRDFETQTHESVAPLALKDIFSRTVYEDVTPTGPSRHPRFRIRKEIVQDQDKRAKVQDLMENIWGIVQQSPLSGEDARLANQFHTQLVFMKEMEQPGASLEPQSPSLPSNEQSAPDVPLMKAHLEKRVDCILNFRAGAIIGGIGGAFMSSAGISFFLILAVGAISAGALGAGIPFAIFTGIFGLIGLIFLGAAVYGVIDTIILWRKYKGATTSEQFVKLYDELMPEAQMYLLVQLGPKFRKDVVEMDHGDFGRCQRLCEFIDNITGTQISESVKQKYCAAIDLQLRSEVKGFLVDLLHEEGFLKKEWVPHAQI